MFGLEWAIVGIVIGLLAGLIGLAAGLAGALVGVIAGLAGGLVGLVCALFVAFWAILKHMGKPVIVAAVLVVVALLAMQHWSMLNLNRLMRVRPSVRVTSTPAGDMTVRTRNVSVALGKRGISVTSDGTELPVEATDPVERTAPVQATVLSEALGQTALDAAMPKARGLLADHLDPNIYQSEGAAIRGLTAQVAKTLDSVIPGRAEPQTLVIKGKISPTLLPEVTNVLRQVNPSANVYYSKSSQRIEGRTVVLYVEVEKEPGASVPWSAGMPDPGPLVQTLRIDVTGQDGKFSSSASFLYKPWVDDFATFVNRNPGQNWILAMSRSPATSAGEALEQAMNDAVTQLEPRVRQRMDRDSRSAARLLLRSQIRSGLEDQPARYPDIIRLNQRGQIISDGLIQDRFVQQFKRPYGDVWQAALLIDASSRKVGDLAERCERVLGSQQHHLRQTALSIAGVIALVCVVYVFLNSVTRGYFVWSLRAGALAVIAGGVYLVLLLV
jgi:hypothetical protein